MKNILLLVFCLGFVMTSQAQSRVVSGQVTDDSGEAIPGVNVILKGTASGSSTDLDGNYRVSVSGENPVLLFSFVGLLSQEVEVGARSVVDVAMQSDVQRLSEVVVTGYGIQNRKDLTGAIASVKGEDIARIPVPGIDQALQGRAAGVSVVNNNGQPGGGISVRIRGSASINSNNQPLYVVDGIPIEPTDVFSTTLTAGGQGSFGGFGGQGGNSMNQINFNDVESIEILKDASATAIYGSRAANGVVLITTKRGVPGKAKLDVGYNTGFTEVFELQEVLNRDQYIELQNEARTNVGLEARPDDFWSTGDTDWLDAIFRTARTSQFSVSARGGSDGLSYFTSVQYDDQEGTQTGTSFERITARVNLDAKAGDKVKFGNSLMVSNTTDIIQSNDNFIIGPYYSAQRTRPDFEIRNPDGTFTSTNQFDNAVAAAEGYDNEFRSYRFLGTFFATYEPIENLILKGTFSADYINTARDLYWAPTTLGGVLNGFGWAERGQDESITVNNTYTANYAFDIDTDHKFNTLIGAEWQTVDRNQYSAAASNFPNDILRTFNSASTPTNADGVVTDWGLQSYFARVNYNYGDRYLFTGTVRTDGSSRFGEDNRFGFFPSLALGWNISNESFFNAPFVETLKLRGSWGITGNHKVGNFASRGLFNGDVFYGGNGGTRPSQIANPGLKWEVATQTDLALDFSLFEGRITGAVDYFVKTTTDILLQVPLPRTSGFNSVFNNVGEMENKGLEIELGGEVLNVNDFRWSLSGNLTFFRNRVIKLVDGSDINTTGFNQSITREGEPLGAFFGYEVDGIFQNQAEIDALDEGASDGIYQATGTSPGDFRFRDTNGDGKITEDDRVILGNPNPDIFGGLTSNMSWKGLNLNAFFQFSEGNDIMNFGLRGTMFMRNQDNVITRNLERWTPENPDTDVPRVAIGDPNNNRRVSSFLVEDGSYLRLKTLTLSYDLPEQLLSNTFLGNVNFYAMATNLWTATNYSGVDPEVSTFGGNEGAALGVDNDTYPSGKTYTFGVKVGF